MNETIEDIQSPPDDGSVTSFNYDDEEGFLDDIRGYFHHIKDELPSSTISKWEIGDKLVFKITNFLQEEEDPIENGENYYIVMEPNTPEQQEEE